MPGYVHGEVVLATIAPVGVLEFVDTITGVINAIAFLQQIDFAVERQTKRAALYRDILPRAVIVRQKSPCVYTRIQGRPNELEFHIGQDRRKNAALPACSIDG